MQGDLGVVGEGLKDVASQRAKVAVVAQRHELLTLGLPGVDAIGPTRNVDHSLHERLVQGHGGIAETTHPTLVT